MSKLKVYVPQDGPYGLVPEEGGAPVEEETCYLKSEVDELIAEKDEEIAELQRQVHDYVQGLYEIQARAENELRHHKFKEAASGNSERAD